MKDGFEDFCAVLAVLGICVAGIIAGSNSTKNDNFNDLDVNPIRKDDNIDIPKTENRDFDTDYWYAEAVAAITGSSRLWENEKADAIKIIKGKNSSGYYRAVTSFMRNADAQCWSSYYIMKTLKEL